MSELQAFWPCQMACALVNVYRAYGEMHWPSLEGSVLCHKVSKMAKMLTTHRLLDFLVFSNVCRYLVAIATVSVTVKADRFCMAMH